MSKKMYRTLCGVVTVTTFLSLSFLFPSLGIEVLYNDRKIASNDHYIGLDGEVSSLPIWCTTCALVGTSSHLLEQEYGSEIDSHSCIFRMGFSPTRGMGNYVGTRTTARIVDSFSFFPFLKRPWKLVTGPFASETWVLFDRRPGDISWFHRPLLTNLVHKHDSKFLWMTKKAETRVHDFLKSRMASIGVPRISALWFAMQVVEDAGCRSLNVYGIPDHQICKRNMNVSLPSLYWEKSSALLCADGFDSSLLSTQSLTPVASLPTVLERKFLSGMKIGQFSSLHFRAPEWPS